MTRRGRFLAAYADFQPDPADRPAAIPAYRCFAALQAAWGKAFCEQYNHALHYAGCNASYANNAGDAYEEALASLRDVVRKAVPPVEPSTYVSMYYPPPSEPDAKACKAYFDRAFKSGFPAERLNSKRAHALWREHKSRVEGVLLRQYQTDLALYQAEFERRTQEVNRARQAWLDECHALALFEDRARDLLAEASNA